MNAEQTIPTLDDLATLRDAEAVLRKLGDPAAARTVRDVLALLPRPTKAQAVLDTAAILDEAAPTGRHCLRCHGEISKGELVRDVPAGFAHRECRARDAARR